MDNGKIIWWIILIILAGIIIWYFGKDEEPASGCCTIDEDMGFSTTFCKEDGKYYSSGYGGFVGITPKHEITKEAFNKGWQNVRCKKTVN